MCLCYCHRFWLQLFKEIIKKFTKLKKNNLTIENQTYIQALLVKNEIIITIISNNYFINVIKNHYHLLKIPIKPPVDFL